MNKFVERFIELRQEKNISKRKLSLIIGVSHTTISRWESGMMYPTIDNIISLCKYFDVTSDYLIGLSD